MQARLPPLGAFIDPRGRSDRKGLLVVTLVMLALQAVIAAAILATGVAWKGPTAWTGEAAMLWLALVATVRRLHDCGLSSRWLAGAAAAVMTWCFVLTVAIMLAKGPLAFAPGSIWLTLTIGAVTVPVLALLVWLHAAQGEAAVTWGPPQVTAASRIRRRRMQSPAVGPHLSPYE